jgi:hypothetical protein
MDTNERQDRAILQEIARKAMLERGLLPDFSAAAASELGKIRTSVTVNSLGA